jgi:hypothetical protein
MSHQAQTHVMTHSRQKGSHRLVLLIIANHAHGDGTNAFPSMRTLAAESLMSERQVIRIVAELERSGELIVERSRGRHAHNMAINMQFFGTPNPDKMSVLPEPQTLTKNGTNPDKSTASTLTNSTANPDIAVSPQHIEKNLKPRGKERARSGGRSRSKPIPLPLDWHVTIEMRAWAEAETPGLDVSDANARFLDYYLGRDGPDGVSAHWLGVWKASMRRQLRWQKENHEHTNGNTRPQQNGRPGSARRQRDREDQESTAEALRSIGADAEL